MNAPIFCNDLASRTEVTRAGICMAAAYLTPAHVPSPSSLLGRTSDALGISRMNDLVVVAMKDNCRDRFLTKLQNPAPNVLNWRLTLPHGCEGRQDIFCRPKSEARMMPTAAYKSG